MLPSSLKTIYQQYKADTDSVATWLATTAKDNGYADKAPSSNNVLVARQIEGPASKTSQRCKSAEDGEQTWADHQDQGF